MGDYASVSVTVPGGRGFRACFKHGAVFANSAMSVRGGFLLRLQILMGLLREKTGRARITPPLYNNGFSRDWTLACQSSLFVDFVVVFLDNGCPDPHLLSGFLGFWKRHILCSFKPPLQDNFSAVGQSFS